MSEPQWTWQRHRAIPSDTSVGRQVLTELIEEMEARDWPEHDVYSVRLAMEEALVNAILHGNELSADKQVQIDCRLAPQRVRIEITDEGDGFQSDALPDPTDPDRLECPGGRGVMLMRAFMSRVTYNDRGNRVVMEKDRDAA